VQATLCKSIDAEGDLIGVLVSCSRDYCRWNHHWVFVGNAVNYPFIYGYVIASIVLAPAGIFAEFVISFFGGIFKK
jgi:hypothetical protein